MREITHDSISEIIIWLLSADGLGVATVLEMATLLPASGPHLVLPTLNSATKAHTHREEYDMQRILKTLALGVGAIAIMAGGAYAQSGSVAKAVGGYSFEDAAKEAEGTKNFHSNDGVLTFAIVTHTAGNGFFDPVYVGALVAANLIGAKVLLLGSESPVDDPARDIEITQPDPPGSDARRPDHDHAAGRRL